MNFTHRVTLDRVQLYPLSARGGVSPNMALGQMPVRPALLIKLVDADGCFGRGEIWANFPPRANIHKAHLVEDVVAKHLGGFAFSTPKELTEMLRARLSTYFLHIGQQQVFEHILAGLDTAAWDLCLRAGGTSFAQHMQIQPEAQCYASSLNPEDLTKRLDDHAAMGQSEFKLKIGFEADTDRAFIASAMAQKPGGSHLMIDSNQCWDLPRVMHILNLLEEFDLLFAEESIRADAALSDWECLANATSIPLAGGENLYGVESFVAMANAGVKFLQPDVAKWGGVTGALELAQAMPNDAVLWPHFMGSQVGQQAGLAITAAIGPSSKCEMDVNENALRTQLCGVGDNVVDGRVSLLDEPGLLAPPSETSLAVFAA